MVLFGTFTLRNGDLAAAAWEAVEQWSLAKCANAGIFQYQRKCPLVDTRRYDNESVGCAPTIPTMRMVWSEIPGVG